MNRMKDFFRMASLFLLAVTAQRAAYAGMPDMGGTPGLMKAGITLYAKGTKTPLPFVTMRFNFNGNNKATYFYLTSDVDGCAYFETPMKNGVITGRDASGQFQDFDLRWVVNGSGGRVDTDPIDDKGYAEYAWGTVAAGVDTRWLLTGHNAVVLPRGGVSPNYAYHNAGLNTVDANNDGRYEWLDEGCSFHFACYVLSTSQTHKVTFDLTGVANPDQFEARTVAHGTPFNTNTPQNVDPDYKFKAWEVCSPIHPEAKVAAPDGALTVTVNQTICLKPLWTHEPSEPPAEDDPTVQFCHSVEPNLFKVAMKVYDWNSGEPLKNVTVGLCFTIPDPADPQKTIRRDNVVAATTDADGVLKMRVPFEDDGYIVVDGIKSTEINLNTVTKIDCGPNAAMGWNWNTTVAGRVRNCPKGYGVHTERVPEAGYCNAAISKVDADGNGVLDYVEKGASLYFECYLQRTSGGDTWSIQYDRSTIGNAEAFANTTCPHGERYTPPAAPINKTAPDRPFLGWRCLPLTASGELAYGNAAFDYAELSAVSENLRFVPVWGINPNAEGIIRFQVRMWDHANYWNNQSKWQADQDRLGPQYGQTSLPIDGLTFVIKSYANGIEGTIPDRRKIPVGRPNTPEGWAESRIEVNYKGKNADGSETWEGVYKISKDQLQYLKSGWIIDTDPDERDLATYDRGLGWGPETVTFDWDWFVKLDDREGAGLTGVRVIPECQRRGGIYPNGSNKNDVILLDDEMIGNGFDFTFQCWVCPALVIHFDTDDGSPASYAEQRFLPLDSCPFWQQRFVAKNPGSPTRGGNEHFEGWYEILSTDASGVDTLSNAPWNFNRTLEHSMTLKAVYRKTGYDVTPDEPAVIRVKGPGTLSFEEILNNPNNDPNTTLTVTVDGGKPVFVTSQNMSDYETKTVVFGGELDIEHVVTVSFETTQAGGGTSANVKLDKVQWAPYDANILDPVADRESIIFKLENLGTNPAAETHGVTFFGGVDAMTGMATISTVDPDTGLQTSSVVNPEGGFSSSTKGTEDYWYLNYDNQKNQLVTNNLQMFAETPPTLSAGEKTSFRVTEITGGSVIRWEALVTDGKPGDKTPGDLTVTVTFTPNNGTPTTTNHVYRAKDFENGQFKPEWLDYRSLPVSTSITLDFTYTNNSTGDGRAYVDNIYWMCAPREVEGVALMIVDHEDADASHVYLAFEPQFAEGVDQQAWFDDIQARDLLRIRKNKQLEDVGGTVPDQIELSTNHTSTINKVWVKVPIDISTSGEYCQIFLGGRPISYKCKDGTITDTSKDGSGATSVNTFGDLKVVTKTANTMVAVPWTWYSDQEAGATALPANKLVKTTNLTEGDLLYSYSGEAGNYLAWSLEKGDNGHLDWAPIKTVTTIGSNAIVIEHGDKQTTLPRGAGLWLVRQNPVDKAGNAVPFWIYGQSVTGEVTTAITPRGEGENAHSTMLGNPYAQEVFINDLKPVGGSFSENDAILIPNGTDSPTRLEYLDTGTKRKPSGVKKWVRIYVDVSSGMPKNVYDWDVAIQPGLAFWYVRGETEKLSVTWPQPAK